MLSDQKNLFIAMALALLVLIGWEYIFVRPHTAEQKVQATAQATAQAAGQKTDATPGLPTATGSAPATATTAAELPRATVLAQTPRIRIDTPRLTGSINLKGARLDDLTLRDYRETIKKDSKNITLLSPSGGPQAYFAEFGWTPVPGVAGPTSDTLWAADRQTLSVDQPITLSFANPTGLTFQIKLAIDRNYMITATQTVVNRMATPVALSPYGLISRTDPPKTHGAYVLHEGPLGVFDALKEVGYKTLVEDEPSQNYASPGGGWIGMTDKYWLAALIPSQTEPFKAQFRYFGNQRFQTDFLYDARNVPAGQSNSVTTLVFAGAKEVALIDAYEKQFGIKLFDRAIDWGWFYYLTRPLFFLLDYLYRLFGNFGLAIIGLTVIVRFCLFPIANKQFASMNKMKLVQPKFKEIQERYKDDKPGQQKALMELYQKEKINPIAGCLPILLQIPIFFALYKVLFVTIEMRHQPFALWIKDLSAADPLTPVNLFGLLPFTPPSFLAVGVLPIIMGVSMYMQMKLNPTPMTDPIQQKIFSWFPFIFTFILAPFAAGLVLYWTTNNLLSILQQWILLKRHPAPKPDSKPA